MDHKVSKDMISSGMIPSGEKTQADLGRTQYGSAPSPSSLMDAYQSIYEHHQKDENGNTIPHEGEELNEALPLAPLAVAAGGLGVATGGAKLMYDAFKSKNKKNKPTEVKPPKTTTEGNDLFDLVKGKLIDEGCDEQEAIKIMISLSEEELQQIVEMDNLGSYGALGAIGGATAALAKPAVNAVRNTVKSIKNYNKNKEQKIKNLQ